MHNFTTTAMTSHGWIRHPELLFDLTRVGLWIQSVHLVVNRAQLIGWNGRVAAETCLQDSVVDEDVLLLWTERSGDRQDFNGHPLPPSAPPPSSQCLIDRRSAAEMPLHK